MRARSGVQRGFSRLSDRVGGAARLPNYLSSRQAAGNSVALPSYVQAGDLLLLVTGSQATVPAGTPAGWTFLASSTYDHTTNANDRTLAVFWKIADGTETTVTSSSAYQTGILAFRDAKIGNYIVRGGVGSMTPVSSVQFDALPIEPFKTIALALFYSPIMKSVPTTMTIVAEGMAAISVFYPEEQSSLTASLTDAAVQATIMLSIVGS